MALKRKNYQRINFQFTLNDNFIQPSTIRLADEIQFEAQREN